MKKLFKRIIGTLACLAMVFTMNITVNAQGTTSISVSKNSIGVGDTTKVTVTASEKGTVTVKYTASLMNLNSCTADGYETKGNSVSFTGTTGDLVFQSTAEGTASIIVSSTSCSGSSTTISIGTSAASADTSSNAETSASDASQAEETAEESTEESTEETVETTQTEETAEDTAVTTELSSGSAVGTLNADGGFDIAGVSYVVSERYKDSEVPSGFTKKVFTIGKSTYSEPTNGTINLLYLKPADNVQGSGVFYIYDEAAGTVSEFLTLGSGDSLIMLSPADAPLDSNMTAATIDVTGGSYSAYTFDGSEFFYVYGTNLSGESNWYLYDKTVGTISRVDQAAFESNATPVVEDTSAATPPADLSVYTDKLDLFRKLISALIILCVILLFIIINLLVRKRDDDFDGDVFAERPSKHSSSRLPRSIVFSDRNRDDEDDYDDDEEYDDEEDMDDYEEYDNEEELDDEDEEYYDDDDEGEEYDRRNYSHSSSASLNMMDLNNL
ncbi:MAG: hypothetical protein K5773_06495 [Pseudobutyrivibrio sp.]|nr:hypothetical protein [Pseudobutyrivibrio sp.]